MLTEIFYTFSKRECDWYYFLSTCGAYNPQSCLFSQICNICCVLGVFSSFLFPLFSLLCTHFHSFIYSLLTVCSSVDCDYKIPTGQRFELCISCEHSESGSGIHFINRNLHSGKLPGLNHCCLFLKKFLLFCYSLPCFHFFFFFYFSYS